jgi:hypothetical protein
MGVGPHDADYVVGSRYGTINWSIFPTDSQSALIFDISTSDLTTFVNFQEE